MDVQDDGREIRRATQGQFIGPAVHRRLHLSLQMYVDVRMRFHAVGLLLYEMPGKVGKGIGRIWKRLRKGVL